MMMRNLLALCTFLVITVVSIDHENEKFDLNETISATIKIEYSGWHGRPNLTTSLNLTKCQRSGIRSLELASDTLGISFNASYYSEYSSSDGHSGYIISGIDGVEQEPSTGWYWLYFINKHIGLFDISRVELRNNDKLIWWYTNCTFPGCPDPTGHNN